MCTLRVSPIRDTMFGFCMSLEKPDTEFMALEPDIARVVDDDVLTIILQVDPGDQEGRNVPETANRCRSPLRSCRRRSETALAVGVGEGDAVGASLEAGAMKVWRSLKCS